MSQITIDSHDFLAKLSVIKSYLSLLIEDKSLNLDEKNIKYLEIASNANQELINQIKNLKSDG